MAFEESFKVKGKGSYIFRDIFHERMMQDSKWGVQDHSQMVWLGILAEEFGEAAKEVNELHFRPGIVTRPPMMFGGPQHPDFHKPFIDDQRKRLRMELIQTAAVAVAMIESLDRNGK